MEKIKELFRRLMILAVLLAGCSSEYSADKPCLHNIENYDDFSGYCWCDPKSCQPSTYKPKDK